MYRFLTRVLTPLLAFLCVAQTANATWSIVVVDNRTREVCIASATCLSSFNLQRALPVVVPEVGVAAAQSAIDASGQNRLRIWNGLHAGETTQEIFDAVRQQDPQYQARQYGIVALDKAPLTFSGNGVGSAKKGVTGAAGDLVFAIQGNVLAGGSVVDAARTALVTTEGDLSRRVMAAMEAAAAMGGDGRCSCNSFTPTACGAPPPSFTFSAYTAFIVLARPGDQTNGCAPGSGCADGSYFLDLNVVSSAAGVEPVEELRRQYDEWRDQRRFFADPFTSAYEVGAEALTADGRSSTIVKLRLKNIQGDVVTPFMTTGIEVVRVSGPEIASIGQVGSHGPNRFGFKVTATDQPGTATYRIIVRQGNQSTQLPPDLVLRSDPVQTLHVGWDEWDSADGGRIPFHLNVPEAAGRPFLLFGSSSGTTPGTPFRGIVLPLNRDRVLLTTLEHSGQGRLPGGVLDDTGHGSTNLVLMPGLLERWVGRRLDWSALILGEPRIVTGPVGFQVLP
jgi:uncharacterized Ntn-hydrolase superfamily protein